MSRAAKPGKVLTAKQEAFALNVAHGMTQSEAYRAAYNAAGMADSTINENASRLMANSKIAATVLSQRAAIAEKAAKSVAFEYEDAMAELDEAIAFAKECKAPGAMVAAMNLKQKISGLHVEERKNDRSPVGDWSPDRVKAALEALQAIKRAKQTQRA